MTQEAVGLGHVPHTGAPRASVDVGGGEPGAGGAGLPNRGLRDRARRPRGWG